MIFIRFKIKKRVNSVLRSLYLAWHEGLKSTCLAVEDLLDGFAEDSEK